MDNSNVTLMKTNNKKKKIFILFSIVCVFLLYGIIIFGYGYHSTDLKNNQQVEDYLIKYMNDKYSVKATLSLKKKKLISICTFSLDGCISYANNKNIYEYEYDGVDNYNNKFVINYTNEYIGRYRKYGSTIVENYKIYDEKEKIKKIVAKYSDNVDIYSNMSDEQIVISNGSKTYADNYIIIRMLVDKIDINSIIKLVTEMKTFEDFSNIFITSDKEVYDEMLSSNNSDCLDCQFFHETGFRHPNILSRRLGYTYVQKNNNVSHYFLNEFKKINFDNDSMYYSIIYYGSSFDLYEKSK